MGCNEAFLTTRLLFPNEFKAKVFKTPETCTANSLTLSPTRPTCFAAENTIGRNAAVKADGGRSSHSKEREEEKIWEQEEKLKDHCCCFGAGIISLAPSSVKRL